MRLICPECNALYDIADAMIPPEGREVECSACGHVWLQLPAPAAPLPPAAAKSAAPAATQDAPQPAGNSDAPRSATMRGLAADLRAAAQAHTDSAPPLGEAPVLQRPLPDDVLSILREETARELGARRSTREGTGAAPAHTPAPVEPAPVPAMMPTAPETSPQPPTVRPTEEPLADWPATTVTRPDIETVPDTATVPQIATVPDNVTVPDSATVPEIARGRESAPASRPAPPAEASPAPQIGAPAFPAPDLGPAPLRMPQDAPGADRPPVPRRRVSRSLPDAEQLAATIQTEIPAPAASAVPVSPKAAPSGYRTGFLRAFSVVAALLLAYVAGSAWVQSGRAPEAVVSLVGGVDHVRAGLQDAVAAILGRKEP